jgi:polyketide synthase 5
MLSATGHCHAFDVAADGFVSGEASVMFFMKRLDDAVRDGDRVLAVIRGSAANQDGHTVNIATPSRDAQIAVYQAALAEAEIDGSTIGYVEAHGTGTPVGDPIEFTSLAQVYGTTGPCVLGSAKTNFGHAQSASGAVGLMKAIIALQQGVVPQNLHFSQLPEQMAKVKTGLFVPEAVTPWPTDGEAPRRAAVSSYGLSGTNVHAVLEQAPQATGPRTVAQDGEADSALTGALLFPLSATSADELRRTAGRLADWVAEHVNGDLIAGAELADLAYTLARRRAHRQVRTAVLAASNHELVKALREVADGEAPYQPAVGKDDLGPVWVFSGQGSQWAGMGAALLASEPAFAAKVAELEPLIQRESGFSVTDAMSAPETVTGINRVQPTVFAVQVALAATMESYGVRPGAVIGHSMGESAAAVVAGALTLDDAVKVICRRSRLMATIAGSGAMASVELPAAQVLSELAARGINDVVLSVVASPSSTVVGGAKESIRELVTAWDQRGVMAREVAVDVASHSPQVDPILDELAEALEELEPLEPTVPYYSSTLYDPRDEPFWDADYWVDNLRHTVRFAASVQAALEDGYRVFGELSPHPLLTHAVDQNARSLDIATSTLAGLRREQELPYGLRNFLSDLHSAGAAVDFAALYPDGRLVDAPLPTWNKVSLLLSRDINEAHAKGGQTLAVHPLLGAHVALPEDPERHVWQADVGTDTHPWLGDHQVRNIGALPGAAYCEMALAAARTILGEEAGVRDVSFDEMLLLDAETPISASAWVQSPGQFEFAVETYQGGVSVRRAGATLFTAEVTEAPAPFDIEQLLAAHPNSVDGDVLRAEFADRGVQYGPAFSGLAAVHTAEGTDGSVVAEVGLPGAIRSQQSAYTIHPALLDACFQAVDAHPDVRAVSQGFLPIPLGVRELRTYGPTRKTHYCLAKVIDVDPTGHVEADFDLLDEDGNVLLSLRGARFGTGSPLARRDRVLNERLLGIEWKQQELAEPEQPLAGPVLVLGTGDASEALAAALEDALVAAETEVTAIAWPEASDHEANAEQLTSYLDGGEYSSVVIVTGASGAAEQDRPARGADQVRHLVRIARQLAEIQGLTSRVYIVTNGAQSVLAGDVIDLELAGLRGLARVIGTEYPHLNVTQIDIDGPGNAEQIAKQLLSGSEEDETAWRAGEFYVARMSPAPLRAEDRRNAEVDFAQDGVRLQIRTPGDLATLEFTTFDRTAPGPGQIEVAITASSINFADVLITFGRYPSFEGRLPELGTDFAGVVTAVGPDVTDHQVGDHVGGLSAHGCWGTFVICEANNAVKLPGGLTDEQAAAVTTASATAWYGLHDLGRVRKGDKVLIHSATGGVGQAAMAICRAVGAEIYATAGSPERRAMLQDMGVTHVYDSRSTEFADQIRHDTGGYGVDIVLNSVTGAAQRAGIELLAFGGRFIEIGKRDIYGDTRIGLFPFRRNLSFYALDLALLSVIEPKLVNDLLAKVYQATADGTLPMPESTSYPLTDAATAIREMSGARHTGKLLLTAPGSGHGQAVIPPQNAAPFRPDGAYVITGGLGGLGLFLAEKMAAAGCGRIILNGRSEPKAEAIEIIERIRKGGTEVEVERGDIAELNTAERLVAAATASGLALRGVLHAAALVEDATLTNITDQLIDRDWGPKVLGAWNLHLATAGESLDWFCNFSSAAALVGSPGQGAYAAANSWVDGFTHWRRSQGLPATAIAWGAWSEIGRGQGMAEQTDSAIAPDEGAYAFEALLRYDRAYSGYTPIMGSPWLTAFAQRSRFAEEFQSIGQGGRSEGSKFLAELSTLPQEEWPSKLRHMVSDQISLILRRSLDPDRPLAEYGLDSLGNLEVRTRIETETGVRISPADITTVRNLAAHICEKLIAQADAPAAT